ncbi:MAG: helix-turn-helix transcriptional regulator [Ruminococcaceae bacterium]|nr:helix-turn-helix transcriptional regulator [Oscillospiraceae bacterium]
MSNNLKLSDVLRSKRYENKQTQEQAAELLNLSVRHYQDLESGKSLPGFKSICKIAKEYNIDFSQFADEEDAI